MNISQYHTSDLKLASFLVCKGYDLHKIKVDDKKGTFYFENINKDELDAFFNTTARVEPIMFGDTMSRLVNSVKRQVAFNNK